ncbi:MAG: hypothetical protein ACYDHN_16280 [Solirubrobacteraceae bacterium]
MRLHVRFSLLALLVGAIVVVSAPAAAQAAFGVESFFAANCKEASCEPGNVEEKGYTQAAGPPPAGITDFTLNHHVIQLSPFTAEAPEGNVSTVRVDVAPGVSTNPEAVTKCSVASFTGTELEPAPGVTAFTAPTCPGSEIGENIVHVVVEVAEGVYKNYEFKGTVYNLEQPEGLSSYFGVALNLQPLLGAPLYSHTFIKGSVEWASDYHDLFTIENITPGLIESRLVFNGEAGDTGKGSFLSNPSTCKGPGPQTTTGLKVTSYEGESESTSYEAPLGTEGCDGLTPFEPVPFAPGLKISAGNAQQDQPNGITTELSLPHPVEPEEIDSSQLKTAKVVLPEGLTLNPSAANGLEACTEKQLKIHTRELGFGCPTGSKLGEVTLDVPGLPTGSLTGSVYLGGNTPITAPPYTMYIDAESTRYGIAVRLKGTVEPNPATGQLTATFSENPEQPFSKLTMKFRNDSLSPLANSLTCGTATAKTVLTPFTGTAAKEPTASFTVEGTGSGGSCVSPVPFAPTQSTSNQTANAGAATSFTVNLARTDGQQYLSHVSTTLPAGLVGKIPTVPLCPAAQAAAGTCEAASAIGTANVKSGAGVTPFALTGTAYLTGPYAGAPYGIDVEVPVVAGPFNLGSALTRLGLYVNQTTGQVTASGYLPSIVYGGVPTRLQQVSIDINRQGFLTNPTNCGTLATESTVTGSLGASVNLSTPFQVGNCSALAFKPKFKAVTLAKSSKKFGASLETTISQPAGEANIKSVTVQLPKQLPSRLTTLQKACPEATFAANPLTCPAGSLVGGARANTPVLPDKMSGPAYLVSHGGAAFPDLDLVLQADGVRVILVGNTNIKNGITTTKFAATPDVPVSSITVNLPLGEHSALAAFGNLCAQPLIMPTTIVSQSGVTVKQNTRIAASGCGVRIVGHKVVGNTAYLTVATPAAGRISGSGSGLVTVYRHLRSAVKATTLKVPLTRRSQGRGRPFHVRLRVGYLPTQRSRGISSATVTVTFR